MHDHSHSRREGKLNIPILFPIAAAVFLLALALKLLLPVPVVDSPLPTAVPDWVEADLLPVNDWSRPGVALDAVDGVVVHYVGNPGTTARQNRDYFAGLSVSQETHASSNFIIGLEGETLLTVPVNEIAYASNNRNSDTLSIEVCHPDESGVFTVGSYDALTRLVQWTVDTYGLTRSQILRHYDVTGKICPKAFVDDTAAWEDFLDGLDFSQ